MGDCSFEWLQPHRAQPRADVQPPILTDTSTLTGGAGRFVTGRARLEPTIGAMIILLVAFAVSLSLTLFVVRSAKTHGRF